MALSAHLMNTGERLGVSSTKSMNFARPCCGNAEPTLAFGRHAKLARRKTCRCFIAEALAMRESFVAIVDNCPLVDDCDDLFDRIERSSKWMDFNGPLVEEETRRRSAACSSWSMRRHPTAKKAHPCVGDSSLAAICPASVSAFKDTLPRRAHLRILLAI